MQKVISLLLTALFIAPIALAQGKAAEEPIGTVVLLEGRADVTRSEEAAVPLALNNEIFRSDILRTKSESRLEIALNDGSRFTMDENTRVEVAEYVPEEGRGLLNMVRGRLRTSVSKTFSRRKDGFRLKTNTSVMGVQGTDFMVTATAVLTTVYVFEGVVSVTSLDPNFARAEILNAGEFTQVRLGQPIPTPTTFTPVETEATKEMGSGSEQDVQSGGLQSDDPTTVAPQPPPVEVPPVPNPPGN